MAKDVSLDTQNYLELYCRADTTFPESHQGAPLNHSDGANLDIEQAFFARLPRSRPEMGSMSLARAMGIEGGKPPVTEPKVLRRSTRRTLAPNKYSLSVPDLRSGVYRTVSDEEFSRSAGANLDPEQAFFARLPRSRPEMGSMSLARAMGIEGGKRFVTEPKVLRRSARRTLAPNKYSPSVPDLRSGVYRTASDGEFSRSAGDVRPPATCPHMHKVKFKAGKSSQK